MDRQRLMPVRDGSSTSEAKQFTEFTDEQCNTTSTNDRHTSLALPVSSDGISHSSWQAVVAIVLQILVAALLLVINRYDIYLTQEGLLSSTTQTCYIVGTTVAATLITTYTLGQIRRLSVNDLLAHGDTPGVRRRISVFIGLGNLVEQLRSPGPMLNMTLTGLITTAIVVGVSPRRSSQEKDAWGYLTYKRNTSDTSNCYTSQDSNDSTSIPASWFTWKLPDGTSLGIQGSDAAVGGSGLSPSMCETLYVLPAMKAPQNYYDQGHYTLGGFPIHESAAGVPYSIEWHGMLDNFYEVRAGLNINTNENLQWVEQCLPVVAGTKTVNCTSDALVDTTDNTVTVRSPDGTCRIETETLSFNPNVKSASAIGACTGNRTVGKATILIGSTNRQADHLWTLMYPGRTPIPDFNGTAGMRCEVNIADQVSFKKVRVTRGTFRDWSYWMVQGSAYRVEAVSDSDEECSIKTREGTVLTINDVLSDAALATAAAASWQLLAENVPGDGWWPTLYAFSNPRDPNVPRVLGKANAIALSLFWGRGNRNDMQGVEIQGRMAMLAVRVGLSGGWGILLIAPSLWSIGVLVWTLRRQPWRRSKTVP